MDILAKLQSGELHSHARSKRPDCVDRNGSVHGSAARASFVDWFAGKRLTLGDNPRNWSPSDRAEYEKRYIPSH